MFGLSDTRWSFDQLQLSYLKSNIVGLCVAKSQFIRVRTWESHQFGGNTALDVQVFDQFCCLCRLSTSVNPLKNNKCTSHHYFLQIWVRAGRLITGWFTSCQFQLRNFCHFKLKKSMNPHWSLPSSSISAMTRIAIKSHLEQVVDLVAYLPIVIICLVLFLRYFKNNYTSNKKQSQSVGAALK